MDQQPRLNRLLPVLVRVPTSAIDRGEVELLAHAVAVEPRTLLVDGHLISPVRIGEPSADRRESILVEIATVKTSNRIKIL